MYVKSIILFGLASIVLSHDINVGSKNGAKIFDEKREASPAIWKQKALLTIHANESDVISGIVIKDERPDKEGEVRIIDGGVGQKNVTVELKSPTVFRGYYYHIEVYALPENEYLPVSNVQTEISTLKGTTSKTHDETNLEIVHPGVVTPVLSNSDKNTNGNIENVSITITTGHENKESTKINNESSSTTPKILEGKDESEIVSIISQDADVHNVKPKGDTGNPLVSPLDISSLIKASTELKSEHKRDLRVMLRFGK